MAKHVFPDSQKPIASYINDDRLKHTADKSSKLLQRLPQLKVWEIQYKPPGYANTCWYVGFKERKDPYILNFSITPSSLNVEFRYSKYLPIEIFDKLKWQNSSWRYADTRTFTVDEIKEMINSYIKEIYSDFNDNKLKQGGKSFAEKIISQSLSKIYPNHEILENKRPDELRSEKNKPLELDLHIPEIKLAIEIQGPQHFRDVYGCNKALMKNDIVKKEWCKKKEIKLIWMNWEGLNKSLFKLSFIERTKRINEILEAFLKSKYNFLKWDDDSNLFYE